VYTLAGLHGICISSHEAVDGHIIRISSSMLVPPSTVILQSSYTIIYFNNGRQRGNMLDSFYNIVSTLYSSILMLTKLKREIMHNTYHPRHQTPQQALQSHQLMIVHAPVRTTVSSEEQESQ
jgi:hypothetical protein